MITIKDDAEIGRLIEALSNDVVSAAVHWEYVKDLQRAFAEYQHVGAQSNTFWSYTVRAHNIAAVSYLCRAYDTHAQGLHLVSFLQTVKKNLEWFSKENFKNRKSDSPFLASLLAAHVAPSVREVEEDIEKCSKANPVVHRLILLRHKAVAHRNAEAARDGKRVGADLTFEDVGMLLDLAEEVLNRYARYFAANTFSSRPIGYDDHEYIFKTINEKVEAQHAETRRQLEQWAAVAKSQEQPKP